MSLPRISTPANRIEKGARVLEVEINISAKLGCPILGVINADKLFLLRPESSLLVLVTVPEVTVNENCEAFSRDNDIGFPR
jgi:hypothetical protein